MKIKQLGMVLEKLNFYLVVILYCAIIRSIKDFNKGEIMQTVLPENSTSAIAKAWYIQLINDIGSGFHADTDAADYVDVATDEPLFSQEQSLELNKSMDLVFDLLPDPYETGLPIVRSLLEESVH